MALEITNLFICEKCDYKQFILFGCDRYYPAGDLSDIADTYETLKEAKEAYIKLDREYKVIYDRIGNKTYHLKT